MKDAVVLLSGGLDSATVLAMAQAAGFRCHCLSFRYGQRHDVELRAAADVARAMGAESHRVVTIDLAAFGGSALTSAIDVPKDRSDDERSEGIPITYVPARNTIFLSFALAVCEVTDARDIFIGVNAVDYSGYPDCRPAFIDAFEKLANTATRIGVTGGHIAVRAPLLTMSKGEIIRAGTALGVDYARTISCYDPTEGRACGRCDACALRKRGFVDAGVRDPTPYV